MTDNEIVKALECCMGCDCKHCPYYDGKTDNEAAHCKDSLIMDALKLVNSQKSHIDWLIDYNQNIRCANADILVMCVDDIKEARAEAIKEFAERLSERAPHITEERFFILRDEIDNLVKEMTEETKHE